MTGTQVDKDGKKLFRHYLDINGDWLIIWNENLSKQEKEKYTKEIKSIAEYLNIKVEFKYE